MREDRLRNLSENMERISRYDRIFMNNPVIMQGMGLAFVVIPANNMQNAFILMVGMLLLLVPTRLLAALIGRFTGYKFRAVLYVLTAGIVYIGVYYIMQNYLFGSVMRSVGNYLPLLVMEPLVIKRYQNDRKETLSKALRKGTVTVLGFCLAMLVVASLREVFGAGTWYGIEVLRVALLPMLLTPAGGFIMVGLVAAVWRTLVNTFKRRVSMGAREYK